MKFQYAISPTNNSNYDISNIMNSRKANQWISVKIITIGAFKAIKISLTSLDKG
jgi:hypothetical protein